MMWLLLMLWHYQPCHGCIVLDPTRVESICTDRYPLEMQTAAGCFGTNFIETGIAVIDGRERLVVDGVIKP